MSQFETKFSTQSETKFGTVFDSTSDLYEKVLDSLRTPYIGENGNWYEWDIESQGFVDTGIKSAGNDGYTPKKGVDYWTEDDKAEVQEYVDEQTEIIKSDVEGLQEQINKEAHFRGYVSTNAKIQEMEATPNDFAYSAESGTVWVYDVELGWEETDEKVPDQSTPPSDATPLMNGVATPGQSNEYARGDHRHPTDTTRLGVAEFNNFKSELEDGIDDIVEIKNARQYRKIFEHVVQDGEGVTEFYIPWDMEQKPFALNEIAVYWYHPGNPNHVSGDATYISLSISKKSGSTADGDYAYSGAVLNSLGKDARYSLIELKNKGRWLAYGYVGANEWTNVEKSNYNTSGTKSGISKSYDGVLAQGIKIKQIYATPKPFVAGTTIEVWGR